MFIALDNTGNRISVENATQGGKYYCPICKEQLTIKAINSLAVKTHFAHKHGTKCFDNWSHDMSEWHLEWQKQFPEQYREVIIEKDGIKHRADICIGNTVIEFQHSHIKREEIVERNNFYMECGYNVVWVFDATDKIKNVYGNSLDPFLCQKNELCWKRLKSEFLNSFPPQVVIFLQYKTHISNKNLPDREYDIMLLLTKISPEGFEFYETIPYYIAPQNFLKQYGAISHQEILSIMDIIEIIKQQQLQKKTLKVVRRPPVRRLTRNRRL